MLCDCHFCVNKSTEINRRSIEMISEHNLPCLDLAIHEKAEGSLSVPSSRIVVNTIGR